MVAILLIAVWLPAVLHCRIESFIGVNCCADGNNDHSEKRSCDGDICDALEAGIIKSSSDQIAVPAPQLCACLECCAQARELALSLMPIETGIIEEASAPPEIIRSRHFIDRAALPARAPDCVS